MTCSSTSEMAWSYLRIACRPCLQQPFHTMGLQCVHEVVFIDAGTQENPPISGLEVFGDVLRWLRERRG